MMLEFFRRLFGMSKDAGREARELALRAEAGARKLSGLPPRSPTAPNDLEVILSSVCLLIDRLAEQDASRREEAKNSMTPSPQTPPQTGTICAAPLPAVAPPPSPSPPAAVTDGALSATAKEIIKLRDWVLLAKSGDAAPTAEALDGVYRKLAQILQKEGVTVLEEVGTFDEERQQIIDTHPTDDPAQDYVVCGTVRTGYLFNGKVIRPQEVVVFTYDASSSSTRGKAPTGVQSSRV